MSQSMVHTCPICGGDMAKNMDSARRILTAAGFRGGVRDPGGVQINMANGSSFRVSGECNACDERVILRFVLNRE